MPHIYLTTHQTVFNMQDTQMFGLNNISFIYPYFILTVLSWQILKMKALFITSTKLAYNVTDRTALCVYESKPTGSGEKHIDGKLTDDTTRLAFWSES